MLQLHRIRTLITGRLVLAIVMLFALTVLVVPAHAGTQINLRVPFELYVSSDCNGEAVTITGEAHLLANFVEDKSGGSHILGRLSLKGSGVSEQGTQYVFSSMVNVQSNNFLETGNGAIEGTNVTNALLISHGSTVNEVVRIIYHVTANANREITVQVLHEETKCVG
jgi:hypothetical protein